MTLDSVCFDLDDTLYRYEDYARAGLRSAADYLERETGEAYHDELVTLYFERDRRRGTFDVLVERHDLPGDLVPDLVSAFHDASTPLSPYPGTEPLLTSLAPEYDLGLITDGRGGHAKLARLGIGDYFDEVLVTPTIDRSKHEPVVFQSVLDGFGARPGAAVYVGDDPRVDFAVPNELGMETVRLRRGRYTHLDAEDPSARPDYEVESLPAVHDVLDCISGQFRRPGE